MAGVHAKTQNKADRNMSSARKSTAAAPRLELTVYENDEKRVVEVGELPCVIGRAKACDLVVADPSVSQRHALLAVNSEGRITVADLDSTNGVYLKRRRISETVLALPAELRLGQVTMVVAARGQAAGRANVEPEQKCYYRRDGREHGPYSLPQLAEMARKGGLKHRDLVWTGQDEDWLRADMIPALFELPKAAETVGPRVPEQRLQAEPKEFRKARRGDIVCPHCWHLFDVEEFLYIARHHDLIGDPVLGPEAQQRFLPSRFTPEGHAVDSAGLSCPDMACPRCHLRIPRTAGEMPPLFASIVGAAASGKSYFLTTMIWRLRNILAKQFALSFTDTDAVTNQIINDFEEKLFLNAEPDELVALRKTELQGELYNQVVLDAMITNLPKPFMFTVKPAEHHPEYDKVREKMSRTLVLYDNAGEHFEPGMDSVENPTTRHILYSDTIFFLFDPTKDVRFRELCTECRDPQLARGARVQRQEVLLTEMINRIEKYSGKKAASKSTKNLIVLVPKSDIWQHLLGYDVTDEPWRWDAENRVCTLDLDEIMSTSFSVRALLERICPELVASAENFTGHVLFLPNSALGGSPELDDDTGLLGIRPLNIKPFWITVPMLYLMHRNGLVGAARVSRRAAEKLTEIAECTISGELAFVKLPGDQIPLQIPRLYLGRRLRCPRSGRWFKLPDK